MQPNSFLLYGAYGYTGELIARFASQYNLQPILAGRREEALKPLASKLNLPYKILRLDDSTALREALREVRVVVHAAGPFHATAIPMAEACLQTGTHYLDINGDINVFEQLKLYDHAAKQAGMMMLPGAGFDVVPTDCLALFLKNKLPDAVALKLAFATLGGGISHGTGMSMIHRLGEGGAIRKDGKIMRVALGHKGRWIDFGPKKIFVMTIPWGDISTAWFSTGIPDIESYTAISPTVYRILKAQPVFNWLLRTSFIRGIIQKKMSRRPAGPSDEQREKALGFVWGQVINEKGKIMTARLTGPEGYSITLHSCLLIAQKVLQGNFKTGYQTPASAYGEDLLLEIPGIKRELLNELSNRRQE